MATTETAPATAQVTLQPYIFFYGRCEEALEFYKSALNGTYEIMRVGDSPMAEHFPSDFRDKVMHGSFTAPGLSFLAADGREARPIDPEAGNISLALSATTVADGERILRALSDGGKIKMPLEDAFWGGKFAMFDDRFGIEWMLTCPKE